VCPLHAWKVNLETGAIERPTGAVACAHTYPTRVEGRTVWIEMSAS
jgi:nitrite reductase/ring-hydroxylating ferredoxin subunit